MLAQVSSAAGASHFGEAVQAAAAAKAERLVVAGLKRLGWEKATLKRKRESARGKVALAKELRAGTTMPLTWIAGRLNLGSRGCLAWLLNRRNPSVRAKSQRAGLLQMWHYD
jgi:hypothetical protein